MSTVLFDTRVDAAVKALRQYYFDMNTPITVRESPEKVAMQANLDRMVASDPVLGEQLKVMAAQNAQKDAERANKRMQDGWNMLVSKTKDVLEDHSAVDAAILNLEKELQRALAEKPKK